MQYKLSDAVKDTREGVVVGIHAIPNSKESKISFNPWEPNVRVNIKSPPTKGKANEEIIELFSGFLGRCELVVGIKSAKKTLLVKHCDHTETVKKLEKTIKNNI